MTLSLAQIEDQLTDHLRTITRGWPTMTRPSRSRSVVPFGGHGSRTSTPKAADNSEDNHDVSSIDAYVSDRAHVTLILHGWARVVMEDFDVQVALPRGTDTLGLCEFLARWARMFSGHDAALDALEEIEVCARMVKRWSSPRTARDWMIIGECPVEVEDVDGLLGPCGGKVRAWPDPTTERDPRCMTCGTRAVIDWWMSHMLGNPATKPLVTATELIGIIAYRLHWTVTHEQIRQWATRGKIERAGRDSKGRTLYDHAEVVSAIGDDVRAQRERQIS